jgi:mono/diheme cytochrome c family protein
MTYRPASLALALIWAALPTPSLPARAQQAANAPVDPPTSPDAVERGKQSFALHCSHCHGMNMVTAGNVTYDLRQFPHDQRERFFESVTNGRDNRMPPWGDVLSQEEIGDIWSYVKTGGKS